MTKIILSIAVLFVLFIALIGFEKVPIDRVGVVVNNFGGGQGTQQEDLQPGLIWVWPFLQKLYLLDPTVQHLDLSDNDSIKIRDKDQYTTDLDLSVIYQMARDDESGETFGWKVAQETGFKIEGFHKIARVKALKIIWEVMSDMETEDFFDSQRRVEQSQKAATQLNASLDKESISVLDVLVRQIVYDPNFEQKLLDRQIYEQERNLSEANTLAEKAQATSQKIERETDALVKKINQEREREILKIESETEKKIREIEGETELYTRQVLSEAEAYAKQAISEGQLALDKARAQGERRINAAYAQAGGEFLIAKKMIEGLQLGEIHINTNAWNPFDVQETLGKILGRPVELSEPPSSGK